MSYQKKIALLICISSIVRLVIASNVELGNDEVYYWTYALHLQYNYFDHPPMVGLLVRLSTVNLLLHSELFVRLGAIVCTAVCTAIMFNIGKQVSNERTGWLAALLYTSSIYTSIIAGTFILPDSPQMVFWLWGILLSLRIKGKPNGKSTSKLWLWFGVAAGLCVMSKVHGAFLWIAVGLYTLFVNSQWLKQKGMYMAGFISLAIASPILIWNIQNNFVTYSYHGNRVNLNGGGVQLDSFIRELLGSFFYNNPINVVLIVLGILFCMKRQHKQVDGKLLLLCGLPLILLLLSISLFRDTFPHWSGPGYTALIPLAAVYLDAKTSKHIPAAVKASLSFIVVLLITGIAVIKFYPGTIPPAQSENLGDGDFTLDMYGWEQLGNKMDSFNRAAIAQGNMPANAPIIVNKWFPAAHIDFYVAPVSHLSTYAIGELFDLHHYQWINQYKQPLQKGSDAYFIMPSNNYEEKYIAYYRTKFDSVNVISSIPIYRNGKICKQVNVFKLKGYKDM